MPAKFSREEFAAKLGANGDPKLMAAAELAVKALLLLKPGVELPGTHGGVSQIFGREYVRTGEVPREWSALLSQKLQLRNRAWYDAQADFTEADVQSAIEFARDVLDFLQKRLETLSE